MSDERTISVAEVSQGPGGNGRPGTQVSLPVVELLTGRGFVTGKSGSGKSNTASVIAENLLDAGYGLLVVDIDGEYYGLKEEYEILHVGADEECDIQVTTEHAEKIASLALEQNVPIILDISSFLDDEEAEALLTEVSKHLFAKAKKLKQPFLMLVEEVHEWIPENGSVGEVGKMLIKIGKRGRKHGLGMVGISQRPADVKKDYITQCDWLVWHRLTWNNDTKVVRRVLDGEYASAVEDLDDGEAFMMTDWSESVRRVQFHRKQTFDAGATPGLDDFERPELKSVSDDLVSELQSISEEKQQRDDTIDELRDQLDEKNSRIAELERELQDARDMSRMAEQFVEAMVDHVDGAAPGRTEAERMRARRQRRNGQNPAGSATESGPDAGNGQGDENGRAADNGPGAQRPNASGPAEATDSPADGGGFDFGDGAAAFGSMLGDEDAGDAGNAGDDGDDEDGFQSFEEPEDMPQASDETDDTLDFSDQDLPEFGFETPENGSSSGSRASNGNGSAPANGGSPTASTNGGSDRAPKQPRGRTTRHETGPQGSDDDAIAQAVGAIDAATSDTGSSSSIDDSADSSGGSTGESFDPTDAGFDANGSDTGAAGSSAGPDGAAAVDRPTPAEVDSIRIQIRGLKETTRRMLAFYDEQGPATPLDAHFVAGGRGDRNTAYAHNRRLRTAGLIEHVGRGNYDTCIRNRIDEETGGRLDDAELDAFRTMLAEAIGGTG